MKLPRALTNTVISKLKKSNKGIIIYGARQVGKTTLVNDVISKTGLKTLVINADQSRYHDILGSKDLGKLADLVEGYKLVFIDEAQRVPEIGITLKTILDNLKKIKLIVTGSSALDLAGKISEPLTGRVWTYRLYPISFFELNKIYNKAELDFNLEERLIYGSYPELFSLKGTSSKREYLANLTDAYLYKDLLELADIRNSPKIRDLLKLLSFQIGSQVSLSELGASLGISKDTVGKYIDYLEKSFVVFRLKGFSRNLRKEVVKMDKIYFYDLGVRNTIIGNLNFLKNRDDAGALWENFLVVERLKLLAYSQKYASMYFWRVYTGAELDFVEEAEGKLKGYEFKFGKKVSRAPAGWKSAYPKASFECINRNNYMNFVLKS